MSKDVGVFAKGTKLEHGDGDTPEIFTEVKGITNWVPDAGGAGDPEKIDVTSGSTVGMVREKLDGYSDKRPGTVDIEFFFDGSNAVHAALYDAAIAGSDENFKLTIPTSTGTKVVTFTARLSGFPISVPFDKVITVKTTLAVKEDSWEEAA
jgi:predicted secreted protein